MKITLTRGLTPLTALCAAMLLGPTPRLRATDGMNMEGYGPISTAMGGTSMAFDNGTAGVINNPATLGLQQQANRLDLALGILGPDIHATNPAGQSAKSESTAFYMPAAGYIHRSGDLAYGLAVFGQGGMGCQYSGDSWRGLGFGLENRSEVSVGRVIAPLAWNINDKLTVAVTADLIWAGMDLKMAMGGAQFNDLVNPQSQQFGRASGTIVQSFGQIMQQMPAGTSVDYAYFDFSNSNPFTGRARGYGYAGSVGVLYRPTSSLSLGLTYHMETELADLTTNSGSLAFQLNVPGMGAVAQKLVGSFRVHDFEWPAMLAGGIAWRPHPRWLLTADVREVYWSSVMRQFSMTFHAFGSASNGSFAGQSLDASLYQDWKDQTIVMVGAAYQASDRLTLRIGGNIGDNPVPDKYLNCLFPATVENHLTAGFGWKISPSATFDLSLTRGFESTQTNGSGITVSHSQFNGQAMISLFF